LLKTTHTNCWSWCPRATQTTVLRLPLSHNFLEPSSQNTPPVTRPPSIEKRHSALLLRVAYHSPSTHQLPVGTDQDRHLHTALKVTCSVYSCNTDSIRTTIEDLEDYGQTTWIHSTAVCVNISEERSTGGRHTKRRGIRITTMHLICLLPTIHNPLSL
jgi:hypothetical protein